MNENNQKHTDEHQGITRRSFVAGVFGAGTIALLPLSSLAGCSPKKEQTATDATGVSDGETFDIIVVGSGGTGMTAAISAHDAGAKVVLLEKMSAVGGNTNFAEGGMNASETALQKKEGIEDSNELFAKDTFIGGKELGNMELINYMCKNSNAAIERLAERGMLLTKLSTSGGASVPRIHRPEDGSAVGMYLTTHMNELCIEKGVGALTDMDVQALIMEDGKVAGVVVNDGKADIEYRAPVVILATGGFGANHEMLAEYRPELLNAVTTNQPGAQGDGIILATAVGADTVGLEHIQVHPTVEQNTSTLLSEGIRGDGAILINAEGNRFTNELLTRDKVTAIEWEQPGGWAYAVFDKHVYDDNTSIKKKFESHGLLLSGTTLEELAASMEKIDPAKFISAVNTYNECIEKGIEDPFGRTASLKPIVNPPYYAIKIAPGIHHTMGGLKIDVNTRVLNTQGSPIPGLFAAGEVAGGVHGGNRLGGNSVCDINVFGHHAAESALEYLKTV
jgi:fumarate reductase flavoprotein subunit